MIGFAGGFVIGLSLLVGLVLAYRYIRDAPDRP